MEILLTEKAHGSISSNKAVVTTTNEKAAFSSVQTESQDFSWLLFTPLNLGYLWGNLHFTTELCTPKSSQVFQDLVPLARILHPSAVGSGA